MNIGKAIKQWTVIGAGPAGISYLTQLLSAPVDPANILWIDMDFNGGALCKYRDVPGNTKVKGFIAWATANSMLKKLASHSSDPLAGLKRLDQEKTCSLNEVYRVLVNYTDQLKKIVDTYQGKVMKLEHDELSSYWKIYIESREQGRLTQSRQSGSVEPKGQQIAYSKNICLAIGAKPQGHTNLHVGLNNKEIIPLEKAFDLKYLRSSIKPGDNIMIVGGSHSAFVIMNLLNSLNIPNVKIYNAYKGEVRFAEYKKDFILYDNTGLKGEVAFWVKDVLEGKTKPNFELKRINVDTEEGSLSAAVPLCNKFIYAHGFTRCAIPEIIYKLPEACGYDDVRNIKPNITNFLEYSNLNGCMMVPSNTKSCLPVEGLYGFGFAFPEKVITRIGELEYNIGLAKFAPCVDKWMKHIKL